MVSLVFTKSRFWGWLLIFVTILSACQPPVLPVETTRSVTAAPLPSQTRTTLPAAPAASSTPAASATLQPAPTSTATLLVWDNPYTLPPNVFVGDAAGDMALSYLDVTGFQANVNANTGNLEVLLQLRDVPAEAELGRVKNFIEHSWRVEVYLDGAAASADTPPDFSLSLLTFTLDTTLGEEPTGAIPGTPVPAPFRDLISSTTVNAANGESIGAVQVSIDSDADTLRLRAQVPGLLPGAGFRFSTMYFDGAQDQPDGPYALATPRPPIAGATGAPTTLPVATGLLAPAGAVRLFPGPQHYAGDLLTIEVVLDSGGGEGAASATLTLADAAPLEVSGSWQYGSLVLPTALDTAGLLGSYPLRIQAQGSGVSVDEVYTLEVLPAEQRLAGEVGLTWLLQPLECCTLHFLSGSAAERDLTEITARINQAAEQFPQRSGQPLTGRLEIYFIDRMWGNGAFGGQGELVVSYTDRYYGPSLGLEGLETLLLHEFTHASRLDFTDAGFFPYNEGLAVFIAGGHYKPEPLAQRGGALYALDYYVPVGSSYPQHEISYLYGAALWTYIDVIYGRAKVWEFGQAAAGADNLTGALRQVFERSLEQFDSDFETWLANQAPGAQVDDLRLTVALQTLRRRYQNDFAPVPVSIFGIPSQTIADPAVLPLLVREARQPAHLAVELLIANAQRGIASGDYPAVELLVEALTAVLASGNFDQPLAAEYLAAVTALEAAGYETLSLALAGDQATAAVTRRAPQIETVMLVKTGGVWRLAE